MDAAMRQRVQKATEQAREERREIDYSSLVGAAAGPGVVGWRDAAALALQARHGEASRAMHLLEFVAEFARALAPRSILDVQVEAPALLAAAHEGSSSAKSVGLVRDERLEAAAQRIAPVDWRCGHPFALLHDLPPERFDLVLASPPPGMKAVTAREAGDPPGRIEYADLLLWRALELIADRGTVLFHTSENFLWMDRRRKRWADFARRGLHVQAAISVDRALWPYSSIETLLVVLGGEPVDELFVGRLDRETRVADLVRNLVSRRSGRDPHLGVLTPATTFRGWRHLMLEREVAEMFGTVDLMPLSKITIGAPWRVRLKPDEPYIPPANCVYIPTLGFGPVGTLPPDLEGKKQYELLEAVLDPALARAEYVAGFLSSPVGKRLRESVSHGSGIQHLARDAADAIRLPVPSIPAQSEAIRGAVHLASMTALVGRLHDELWRRPEHAIRLLTELEVKAKVDPAERWLETLPYPLASILHRYVVLRDVFKRYDAIAHFHEAMAQFGCAVLLGVLCADAELLASSREAIRSAAGEGRVLFDRGDFGTWINLGRTLAKAVRRLDGDKDTKPSLEAAAGPAVALMGRLADKELWHVLDRASKIRNAEAHGGVRAEADAAARTEALEIELSAVEQVIASGFDDLDVVRAEEGRLTGGIHRYPRAHRLRGANSEFGEFELRTRVPLESGHLVLVSRYADVSPVLALPPMVLVGDGTEENRTACYFFNKTLDDGRFKYVSYHFEDKTEIGIHQGELQQLIADLRDTSASSAAVRKRSTPWIPQRSLH